MDRSWVKEKSFFPLILAIIFMAHMFSLILRIDFSDSKKLKPSKKPIVVKLIPLDVKKQIVQSEDNNARNEVVEDAFLSDKNRAYDRQTRARKNDVFQQGQSGGGSPKRGVKDLKLSDLGMAKGEDPFREAAKEYTKQKNGKGKGPDRKVSSTNDYIEEIPLGDLTNLNTVEYKYYGFYHRIRQKLEQFWGRSIQDTAAQMAQEGRRVPASEEMITALQITLDHEGEIIAIKVVSTSGIKELDDAAIESFNQAGPFPNPPKGLIVDGKVTLEWGFVVKS